jgi:hypothetical protein
MDETAPQPTPQRHRKTPWLSVGALALSVGVGFGGGLITADAIGPNTNPAAADTQAANTEPADGAVDETKTEDEPEPSYSPVPTDFDLAVKITRKKCFGSAGCNIDYQVELSYNGLQPLDDLISYDLTYEVTGGEDGPAINTLTVPGDAYSFEDSESASTASSSTVLKATVTDVEPE